MLEAYCFPRSAVPGESLPLHVVDRLPERSTSRSHGRARRARWCGARRRARPRPTRRPTTHPRTAAGGRRRSRSRSATDWRSGYYSVTLTAGDERADAFLVVRPATGHAARADDPRALDHARGTPTTTGAGRACTRAARRCRSSGPLARGFLDKPQPHRRKMQPEPDREALWYFEWAEPLGLSVWSGGAGWADLGARLRPLGRVERLRARRRDLRGPRAASRRARRAPPVPVGRPRRVLVVGHARDARRLHRRRRERGDPQREHVLLAGALRRRAPRDDLLQVPGRRGPGGRHARRAPRDRTVERPAHRAGPRRARSA